MVIFSLSVMIVLLIVLLFLPALRELRNASDAQRLHIDETFILDPRFFGKELRRSIASHADEGRHEAIGALSTAYVRESVATIDGATMSALASDGSIFLGRHNSVTHWMDAEDDIVVSNDCFLGESASSAKSIALGRGSVFKRLYGRPVMTERSFTTCDMPPPFLHDGDRSNSRLIVHEGTTLHEDVVSKKSIQVGAGAVVNGSIKSHGSLDILDGARVTGNIFARGAIHLHPNVVVLGTVFTEGDVCCEDRSEIGSPSNFVSVFSGGSMRICGGVRMYGWIVAQGGGSVQ